MLIISMGIKILSVSRLSKTKRPGFDLIFYSLKNTVSIRHNKCVKDSSERHSNISQSCKRCSNFRAPYIISLRRKIIYSDIFLGKRVAVSAIRVVDKVSGNKNYIHNINGTRINRLILFICVSSLSRFSPLCFTIDFRFNN